MNKHRGSRIPSADIDKLLRRGAPAEIEEGSGRLRPRVEARIAATARAEPNHGTVLNRLTALFAVALIAVAVGVTLIGIKRNAAPEPTIHPPLRLGMVIDRRADALMKARPEQPILTEARRLRTDVERGIIFVRSVLPRLRVNG